MADLKQSTIYTRMFLMVQSSDHITGITGATVTVTLSKAGGAFAAPGGAVTEVANGWYKIALTTTDTNTLGELVFHCTATSADPRDFVDQVRTSTLSDTLAVNVTQYGGVNGTFSGGLPAVNVTQFNGLATTSAGGIPAVNVTQFGGVAGTFGSGSPFVLLTTGTTSGQVSLNAGVLSSNMVQVNAHAVADSPSGALSVNTAYLAGTAQTASDIGVLNSATGIDGYSIQQIMEMLAAVAFGKSSGLPLSPVFRSANDTANRVSGTTDGKGNRSSVTLNP